MRLRGGWTRDRYARSIGSRRARIWATSLALALVSVASACSASRGANAQRPASTAQVSGYVRSLCGGLRALRSVSSEIRAFMPQLSNDSTSRTALKAQLVDYLRAAGAAAALGERFVASRPAPNVAGGAANARAVEQALSLAHRDYRRWQTTAAQLPTYDRDNWEDVLSAFEHNDMVDAGSGAWTTVRAAATSGSVGRAVQQAARSERECAGVLS